MLAPYLAVGLAHRAALQAQAVIVLTIVVVLALRAGAAGRPGREPAWGGPGGAQLLGALLYLGAASLGAVVGLATGNAPVAVAGQWLSMALLPLAWWAASRESVAARPADVSGALTAAVGTACGLHLAYWLVAATQGRWLERMALASGVSVAGTVPLAALLAAALVAMAPGAKRRGAQPLLWAILLFALASGGRGGGLILAAGLAALAVTLEPQGRWRLLKTVVLPGTILAVSLLLGGVWTERWIEAERPNLVTPESLVSGRSPTGLRIVRRGTGPEGVVVRWRPSGDKRQWRVTRRLPAAPATYLVRAGIGSSGVGRVRLGVRWSDRRGRVVRTDWGRAIGGTERRPAEILVVRPRPATALEIVVRTSPGAAGTWELRRPQLRRIGPPFVGAWGRQVKSTSRRLRGLLTPGAEGDASLEYRRAEAVSLLSRIQRAPWGRRLLGQGLGATFSLAGHEHEGTAWGRPTVGINYVHDFYLFLLFKLGLVGTLAVVLAIALWTRSLLRSARALPAGLERALATALLVAWLAYCAWSVTSPEILDFRTAPLWGLLFATLARPAQEGSAPGTPGERAPASAQGGSSSESPTSSIPAPTSRV